MRCSPFCLRAWLGSVLFLSFGAPSFAAGSSDPAWSPLLRAPGDPAISPLGGPVVPSRVTPSRPPSSRPPSSRHTPTSVFSNAQTAPPHSTDELLTAQWPSYGNSTDSDLADKSAAPTLAGQPSTVLGPTPYDLVAIKRIQVANQAVAEAPLRVGNLDILAPLVDEMPLLGATITSADPKNVPGFGSSPTEEQHFQINVPGGPPIVMTIGKTSAWINDETGFHQQQLRAAPLVIGRQIYLPIFSLAPLLGAAARLRDDGTLVLTPTIQSVEVLMVKDVVAVTIKASMPVASGAARIVAVKGAPGSSPKVYVDFPGYSMGFDAGNSTIERQVAQGAGDVLRARVGMPSKFPDTTRIVLDLKRPLFGTRVMLDPAQPDGASAPTASDPTLFALVLTQPGQAAPKTRGAFSGPNFPDSIVPNPQPAQPAPGNPFASLPGNVRLLRGKTIVVDAGHGGHDTGARGAHADEKDLALDIALRLRKNLQSRGANVLMTRENDTFISLAGRSDFANQRSADLFISVHINASPNKTSTGTETFYTNASSQSFAREVHQELVKASGRPNRKIHQRGLWVTRHTWMPSILTETAFISNSKEEALLRDPAFRERVARGIAQGVCNYVSAYGVAG